MWAIHSAFSVGVAANTANDFLGEMICHPFFQAMGVRGVLWVGERGVAGGREGWGFRSAYFIFTYPLSPLPIFLLSIPQSLQLLPNQYFADFIIGDFTKYALGVSVLQELYT